MQSAAAHPRSVAAHPSICRGPPVHLSRPTPPSVAAHPSYPSTPSSVEPHIPSTPSSVHGVGFRTLHPFLQLSATAALVATAIHFCSSIGAFWAPNLFCLAHIFSRISSTFRALGWQLTTMTRTHCSIYLNQFSLLEC